MPLVAVNFHYVGMPAFPHDGIHCLSIEEFRSAVTRLATRYELVSLEQVVNMTAGTGAVESDLCLITFDDGLRCQFDSALPVLDDLHAPAAFFVSAGPLRDQVGSTIHKLHWARANFGDEGIAGVIRELESAKVITLPNESPDVLEKAQDAYRYDKPATALLKFTMNYLLSENDASRVLSAFFDREDLTESDFVRELYMSTQMVREIGRRNSLGSHAVSHRPLAAMSAITSEAELRDSKQFLELAAGCLVGAVSYPLGNASAVSRDVGRAAARCGYTVGFTMERAVNTTLNDALLLARCDAADIEGIEGFAARRRYFEDAMIPSASVQ